MAKREEKVLVTPVSVRVPLPAIRGQRLKYIEPGQKRLVNIRDSYWLRTVRAGDLEILDE